MRQNINIQGGQIRVSKWAVPEYRTQSGRAHWRRLLALVKESSRSAPRIELPFRNERLAPRISSLRSLRFVCPPSRFLRLPANLLSPQQEYGAPIPLYPFMKKGNRVLRPAESVRTGPKPTPPGAD